MPANGYDYVSIRKELQLFLDSFSEFQCWLIWGNQHQSEHVPVRSKIRYSHAMTFLLAQYENNIAIAIRVMLQSMSGMEILFNMLVNRLHKTIVGIPYQISGVKNNFILIKLQIRRFYLPEEWLAVVVILSGGTMSMVLLVLVMIQNNQDHHYHRFFFLSSCCRSKV